MRVARLHQDNSLKEISMKPNLFDTANAAILLNYQLAKMYDQAEVASLLGIKSEKPDEFWTEQRRTVAHRFYAYLLSLAGLEPTLVQQDLTVEQYGILNYLGQHHLRAGLNYTFVRNWWLSEGVVLHTIAFDQKRVLARRAKQCLRLVAIIPGVGLRYARPDYSADSIKLFEEQDRDFGLIAPMPEESLDTPEYRKKLCEGFQHFKDSIGATELKFLPSPR